MIYNRYGFEFLEIGDNLSAKTRNDVRKLINAAREYKTRHEDFHYQIDKEENGETTLMRVGKTMKPESHHANKYNFAEMKPQDKKTLSGDAGARMLRAAKSYADYHFGWKFHTERANDGTGTITITRIEVFLTSSATEQETLTTDNETPHDPPTDYNEATRDKSYDDPGPVWEATEEHWQEYQTRIDEHSLLRTRDDYMTLVVGDAKPPAISDAEWTAGLNAIPRVLRPRVDWEGHRIPHWTEIVGVGLAEPPAEPSPREAVGGSGEGAARVVAGMPTAASGVTQIEPSEMSSVYPEGHADDPAERERLATLPISGPDITDVEFKLRLDARTIDAKTGKLLPNKMTYNPAIMPVWDTFDTDN